MKNQPLVSVLMTTYNGERFVRETIDSILQQTYRNFELIIIDDSSKDSTISIIQKYKDPRITLHVNENNMGISRSRNKAVGFANGSYIAATDQDDLSLPRRLESEVAFLEENPKVVLVATAAKEMRNGKISSLYKAETRPHIIRWRLYTRSSIVHSSICYRKGVADHNNIHYDPQYHYAEDFVLFQEFSRRGEVVILPEELVIYREHESNSSSVFNDDMVSNVLRYLEKAYKEDLEVALTPEEVRDIVDVFNIGTFEGATEGIVQAGKNYYRLMAQFLNKGKLTPTERRDILQFACDDWWRVVSKYSGNVPGKRLFDIYNSVPELTKHRPSWIDRQKALLKIFLKQRISNMRK